MASDAYQSPVAISRLSEKETSRDRKNMRSIKPPRLAEPLPNGIDGILDYVAGWPAGTRRA